MTLLYTDEQEELRSTVRRFLAAHLPESTVRGWMESDTGYETEVWELMSGQLGLCGLLVPLDYGGSGAGPAELIAVFEEAGRVLLATPLLASGVLAAAILSHVDDEGVRSDVLPGLASGTCIGAFADAELWADAGDPDLVVTQGSDTWRLDGIVRRVIDGQNADAVFVPVRTGEGPVSLCAFNPREDSAEVVPLRTLDRTRKQADIILRNCPARPVGSRDGAQVAIDWAAAEGALAVAAEALGGAEQALDSSVEYASQRIQFGRVIGEFQAIKHKCANMKLLLEGTRAIVHHAAQTLEDGGPFVDVSLAKLYACNAFIRIAAENLQIHGGMGCTWEHSAHLYLRRAKALQHLLGSPGHHRTVLARHLRLPEKG